MEFFLTRERGVYILHSQYHDWRRPDNAKSRALSNSYRQISNIRGAKSPNFFSFRLAVVFARSIEARCFVGNEDIVGAAPTGVTPTIYEWSTVLFPTEVRLISEVLQYIDLMCLEELGNLQYVEIIHVHVLKTLMWKSHQAELCHL